MARAALRGPLIIPLLHLYLRHDRLLLLLLLLLLVLLLMIMLLVSLLQQDLLRCAPARQDGAEHRPHEFHHNSMALRALAQ